MFSRQTFKASGIRELAWVAMTALVVAGVAASAPAFAADRLNVGVLSCREGKNLGFIIGSSRLFIGQAVYAQQGTAGNIPLAAAFSVVPIVIMGLYLWMAKRQGAFDAL